MFVRFQHLPRRGCIDRGFSAMGDDIVVPRRSPGNPRTQSVVILDPEDLSAELLNQQGPRNSRVNGFSPPQPGLKEGPASRESSAEVLES